MTETENKNNLDPDNPVNGKQETEINPEQDLIPNSSRDDDISGSGGTSILYAIPEPESIYEPAQLDEPWRRDIYNKLAHVVSIVLNPLVMPLYAILLLLFGRSLFVFIPGRLKWFYILVVVINTLVMSALFVGLLRSTGYISNINLYNRRDRFLPLIITVFCYGISIYMVSDQYGGYLIKKFLLSGGACVLFATMVTLFWKISLHMIAIGGAVGIVFLLNISGIGLYTAYVIAAVICAGMLGSARLYLGAHTPMQVLAGFISGAVISTCVLLS